METRTVLHSDHITHFRMILWRYIKHSSVTMYQCNIIDKHSTAAPENTIKPRTSHVILWNILEQFRNSCFLCEYLLKCNLFLWSKLYFHHHYSSLQCHMIFRNHNNMLICCSRNISDYYQCWKQLCCTIFLWKPWYILFFRIHRWIESSKEQHLFEI